MTNSSYSDAYSGYHLVVDALDITGGFLTALGAGFIILCYILLDFKAHFRHAMILNLAVADFIIGLAYVCSTLFVLIRKEDIPRGPGCDFDGFMIQFGVQAVDCCIFAITVLTVLSICSEKVRTIVTEETKYRNWIMCGSCWILPIATSTYGLIAHRYRPASGSWCWVERDPVYLRYVLTQAWRLLFIFCEVGLYIYLWVYLHSHFNNFVEVNDDTSSSNNMRVSKTSELYDDQSLPSPILPSVSDIENANDAPTTVITPKLWQRVLVLMKRKTAKKVSTRPKQVKKVLLLSAYPIAYIILWLPGIANRLLEATGRKSPALQILQTSTTFVGFVNSVSFGGNEKIRAQFKKKLGRSEDSQ